MCHNANDAARIDRGDRGERDEPPCLFTHDASNRATTSGSDAARCRAKGESERNETSNTFNKIRIFSVMLFNRFVKLGG